MTEDLRKAIRKFKDETGATEVKVLCGNSFYWKLMTEASMNSPFTFGSITHFDGNAIENSMYVPQDAAFLMDTRWFDKTMKNIWHSKDESGVQEYPLIKLLKSTEHWRFLVV